MTLSSLSIGVACYNDAPTIGQVLEKAASVAAQLASTFRVIVVDDGSSDDSPRIIAELAKRHGWLESVRHSQNRGFGATFGTLYHLNSCEFNAILPGDGQVPAEEIGVLASHIDNYDVILGWRQLRADSPGRRWNSFAYNSVVSLLRGRIVRDVNSISLARTSYTSGLKLTSASAFIHAEFFLECCRRGARTVEVPISHLPRRFGRASGGQAAVASFAVREVGRYALRKGPVWLDRRKGEAPAPGEDGQER